jgi:hypothetical protein
MARIDTYQPLDPVLQGVGNEIKANWRLGDIADAFPGRLDAVRELGPTAKNAPVEVNWGLALLTDLRANPVQIGIELPPGYVVQMCIVACHRSYRVHLVPDNLVWYQSDLRQSCWRPAQRRVWLRRCE